MKYCLIGEKLGHSYSADIHKKNGLDYSLKEVPPQGLKDFFGACDYDGFNITIPYKKSAMEFIDFISEDAKNIGSVNTVLKEGGKFYGYNTDISGMEYLFKRKNYSLKGKNAVILGTGGTGQTAKYLALKQGAKSVKTVSRTGDINYSNCYKECKDAQVIINTTPLGTFPDVQKKAVSLYRFSNLEFVADAVYNPLNTELITEAKSLGINCSNGLSMLVAQALYAESIWTGKSQTEETERILKEIYREKANIVLLGMPSSGKTVLGKSVAEKLNREFVDTDELIEKKYGVSPAKMITERGEEVFRDAESAVIKEISLKNGAVVSLGGGAVLREKNVTELKRNGVLVYVKRDLKSLSSFGRPISSAIGVEELFRKRKGAYEKAKDCEVTNDAAINDCAKEIIKVYENTCDKRC